jgi:hypothetical protein
MDLKQFLELFNPKPGNRFLQVSDRVDETTISLNTLLNSVSGELHLVCYGTQDCSLEIDIEKTQYIQDWKTPFRALPREHDIVIFKDIFHLHQNQDILLKIAYTTLANNADIIIMQEKETMDVEALEEKLEKFEFRSANYIDVLSEYDLIMAKKMHMWGNGL